MCTNRSTVGSAAMFTLGVILLFANPASAHCDGMDGPVVKAAQQALASGNVNAVLIWVQKDDEEEIQESFQRTLSVRKLGPEAQELADHYFFETLVRVHRTGEGAPYTGLKPAGRDLGPAIPLADQALASGHVEQLVELITEELRKGLQERFDEAKTAQSTASTSVEAGRHYVASYVAFIHYAERAYEAASQTSAGHFKEPAHAEEVHEH